MDGAWYTFNRHLVEGGKEGRKLRAEILKCFVHCTPRAGKVQEHTFPEAKVSQTLLFFVQYRSREISQVVFPLSNIGQLCFLI